VYDLAEAGGGYRLIAEWGDGAALAATLRRGSLSPSRAVSAVGEVMSGLAALHARGLFHGQVGPETVVIDSNGRARLAELAICAAAAPPGSSPQTDVRDAARLGLHLLRNAGPRFDAVRRPLDAAASGAGTGDARRLREELDAAAAVVLGASWNDGARAAPARAPTGGHRRRRLVLPVLAVLVVAAAAVAGALLLASRGGGGAASTGPLAIGSDASLGVTPATAGCNTTFSFIARGSLSGAGTLVYRWEQSDGQTTADTSLPITSDEGAFQLTEAWRLQGSQKVSGTMTLHILKPVDRKLKQAFTYSCP
jgi:serine/threonine protein kinase